MTLFGDLAEFFEKFDILGLAVGLMIGASLKDVANNLIEEGVMPFIKPFLDKMNKKVTEDGKIKIGGKKNGISVDLSKIIESIIKFISLSLIILILIKLGVKVKKRPKKVRIANWDKMPKRGSRSKNLKLH